MLSLVGDDEVDIIKFPDGTEIHIDFGIDKTGPWGWRGRISGKYRRVRLYDKRDNLQSEIIEINPLYRPSIPKDWAIVDGDPKIIY